MLNGVANSRESSSLSELSHPTHNIMYYRINVIHTTRLNSKANSKKKSEEDKYLISSDQIQLMKNFKGCSGVNQLYVFLLTPAVNQKLHVGAHCNWWVQCAALEMFLEAIIIFYTENAHIAAV